MATYYTSQNTSHRAVAMLLALATAVVLSPLYLGRKNDTRTRYYDSKLSNSSTGFVLPVILAGLIIAIKTTSSSQRGSSSTINSAFFPSPDPSWVLRIGSSSWGLAGVLVMLMLVLSWQDSVQQFFWR